MSAPWLLAPDSKSFLQRHSHWHDVLNCSRLLASHAEIQKSKSLMESLGPRYTENKEDKEVTEARKLCEVSVHPDSGHVLPLIFRPPAYVLLGAPLAVAALIPCTAVASAVLYQIPFQTYNIGFTLLHANRSLEEGKPQNLFYMAATILYLNCMGAAPALAMKKLGIRNPSSSVFFSRILPTPLYALLGGLNVALLRFPEVDSGIEVMDEEGNVVGASHKAAGKALKETVLSRSALFGITALITSLCRSFSHKMRSQRRFTLLSHMATLFTFGLMIPVTFSFFPQKGEIRRDDLEDELKEKTSAPALFYNRGL